MQRPTKEEIKAAANKTVPDVIAPDLRVLFCGINPGLYTAAVGHHFARPGNRFWPALHLAGFTPRHLTAFEEAELLPLGLGITNLVARATASADELTAEALRAGGEVLRAKVAEYRPQVVAILGVTAYRQAFAVGQTARRGERRGVSPPVTGGVVVGEQRERLGEARVWVLPNP